MTSTAHAEKCRFALDANDRTLELPERFVISAIGGTEHQVNATGIKLVNRRLIARVSESLAAGECIRINARDSFVLGEVLGCWREGQAVFAAIELQHALTRLAELAAMMGTTDVLELRRSA